METSVHPRDCWRLCLQSLTLSLLLMFSGADHLAYGQQGPQGDIYPQLGHQSDVTAVAFSPDGRLALSGSSDDTLKLWDVATGREIRTMVVHPGGRQILMFKLDSGENVLAMPVQSIAYSPDGRTALSAGSDSLLRLWDVTTGEQIRTFPGHARPIWSVAFSPDGRLALTGSLDKTIKLWDIATGREIRTMTGHTNLVQSVAFSPDGRFAISGSKDATLKVWNISTGEQISTLTGHRSGNDSFVAFSPDGRSVLSSGEDSDLKMWDRSSGKPVRSFVGHSSRVSCGAFSPDGRLALSGSFDKTLKLWDVTTGREIRTMTGHTRFVHWAVFSPDGRFALSAGAEGTLKLWEVATGEEVRTFGGLADWVHSVAFSPDGRFLMTGSDRYLKLWQIATGSQVRTLSGATDVVTQAIFSPDGRRAISTGRDNMLRLWDLTSGVQLRSFGGQGRSINSVAFSPSGHQVVSGGADGTVKLWDLESGTEVRAFAGHSKGVGSTAFSPDGRLVLSTELTIKLWDVANGQEVRTLNGDGLVVPSAMFSNDGRFIVSGGVKGGWSLWEAATGKAIRSASGHSSWLSAVVFSPDNRLLATASLDKTVKLWEVETGKEIRTFTGHTGGVRALAFSPDGKLIVSGSEDATMRLWDVESGQELVRMINFKDGEWVAITPDGHYAASPKGDQYLAVRIGSQVYGVDQWRARYYNPAVIEKTIALRNPRAAAMAVLGNDHPAPPLSSADQILPPIILVKSPADGARLGILSTELVATIEDRRLPIQALSILVNGRRVGRAGDRRLTVEPAAASAGLTDFQPGQRRVDLRVALHLERGDNVVEIVASNGVAESRRELLLSATVAATKEPVESLPELWLLTIGVNRYDSNRIPPLQYAVADAKAIADIFSSQEGKLYRKVHTLVMTDNSAIKPTRDNILDNLGFLRRAGQNDVIMLFIAGHAVNDEDSEYNLLPSDASFADDGSLRRSRMISSGELRKILELPAKKIVLLDTCHSAGVSGKRVRSADSDQFVRSLKEFGPVVFTSSRGEEYSQESNEWGHGAFTKAILEGLSGKAYPEAGGMISMKALDLYVSKRVPELTGGQQHPITYTPDGYANFPVALTDGGPGK